MRKIKKLTVLSLLLIAEPLLALNLSKYTNDLSAPVDPNQRSTLLGVFQACGEAKNMDDSCVLQGLERVATEENNSYAATLLGNYEDALNLGNYSNPECQQESHAQANRIVGHCMLLMNYYALQTNDTTSATNQYYTCLQGGMLGLTYGGNIVAQFMLSQVFGQKGLTDSGQTWERALKMRKDTDEFKALMKCYQ